MESFSIACTTCQVRLRVRDSSAIGQILTCPKCGSMVLVQSPDEDAQLAETIARPQRESPGAADAGALVDSGREPKQDPLDVADTVEDLSVYGTWETAAADARQTQPAASEAASADEPLLPTDQWTSEKTLRWRSSASVMIAAVLGIVLALGVFGLVISKPSRTAPSEASLAASDPAPRGTPPPDREPPPTTSIEQAAAQGATDDPHDLPPPTEPSAEESSALPAETAAGQTEADDDDTIPPGFTPRDVDATEQSESLPETLDQFESLLGNPPPPLPAEEATDTVDAGAPTAEAVEALPRPQPRAVNVAERLDDALQAIEFHETPLVDFLRFMSDYSTIPITLHPESMTWLKISPSSPVSVEMTETTVSAVLNKALQPLRLDFAVLDGHLLVGRASSTADGSLRRVPFDISDLSGDAPAADLLPTIVDLIAPKSWEANGGTGRIALDGATLVVAQRDEILFEVLFFLEKLRVARGLAPRSRFDARLFRLAPPATSADPRLQAPVSLNYIRPTPFATIVGRLEKATGTHLLIDWHALAAIGWTQDSAVSFQVDGQPLQEALAILLEPMELTYRVVDQSVLQITTPRQIRSIIVLEFYPVGGILAEAPAVELTDRMRTALATIPDATGTVRLDSASQCLVVAAPKPVHDTIAELLANWDKGR